MNFNDISAFLDLVKDPAKYDKYLQELVTQQANLQKMVEAVGKVGEIDGLKQKAEKEVSVALDKAAKILEVANKDIAKRNSVVDKQFADLAERERVVARQLQEALTAEQTAQALSKDADKREKVFTKLQVELIKQQKELDEKLTEVDEKLAKLRAVMS